MQTERPRDRDGAPLSSPLISPIYQPVASVLLALGPFQQLTNGRPPLSVSRLPFPVPPVCPRPPPSPDQTRPERESSTQAGLGTAPSRTRPGTWPDNERTPTLFQPRLTSHLNPTRPLQNNNTTTTSHGLDTTRPESTRPFDRIGSTTNPPPSSMPPTTGSA